MLSLSVERPHSTRGRRQLRRPVDDPTVFAAPLPATLERQEQEFELPVWSGRLADVTATPLATKTDPPQPRRTGGAFAGSLAMHVAAALLLVGLGTQQVLMRGLKDEGILLLGNASVDQEASLPDGLPAPTVHLVEMVAASAVAGPVTAAEAERPENSLLPVGSEVIATDAGEVEPVRPESSRATIPSEIVGEVAPVASAAAAQPAREIVGAVNPQTATETKAVQQEASAALPAEQVLAVTQSAEHSAPLQADGTQALKAETSSTLHAEDASAIGAVKAARGYPPVLRPAEPAERVSSDAKPSADATLKPAVPARETSREIAAADRIEPVKAGKPRAVASGKKKDAGKDSARKDVAAGRTKASPKSSPAEDEAKPGKPAARTGKSGKSSQAADDSRRGVSTGQADGRAIGKGSSARDAAEGNAAVSNYPGEVAAKLRRSLRYPPEASKSAMRGRATVTFRVSASGDVSGIGLSGSSGSAVLDRAALEAVHRAAPFPPIPADARRKSWTFTVPLAFARR